jgi:hypothetical protein
MQQRCLRPILRGSQELAPQDDDEAVAQEVTVNIRINNKKGARSERLFF